jgi:hypothetical protein
MPFLHIAFGRQLVVGERLANVTRDHRLQRRTVSAAKIGGRRHFPQGAVLSCQAERGDHAGCFTQTAGFLFDVTAATNTMVVATCTAERTGGRTEGNDAGPDSL